MSHGVSHYPFLFLLGTVYPGESGWCPYVAKVDYSGGGGRFHACLNECSHIVGVGRQSLECSIVQEDSGRWGLKLGVTEGKYFMTGGWPREQNEGEGWGNKRLGADTYSLAARCESNYTSSQMQIRLKFLNSHLPCQLPSALTSLSGGRGEFV